jgi:hypothetical protein
LAGGALGKPPCGGFGYAETLCATRPPFLDLGGYSFGFRVLEFFNVSVFVRQLSVFKKRFISVGRRDGLIRNSHLDQS